MSFLALNLPPATALLSHTPSTSFKSSYSNTCSLLLPLNCFRRIRSLKSMSGRRRSWIVGMTPEEEKITRRLPLDFPIDKGPLHFEERVGRRILLTFLAGSGVSSALPSFGKTKKQNPYDERRLLEQNKRIQRENNVPDDFPNFVREGFAVKVVTPENYVTRDSGLILRDVAVGEGDCPKDGQQVTFHYIGYNESGRRIDSTYFQGSPAKVRLGTNALIPGFEEGIRDMKPGGKRRIIVPPELGPPVGPSTFFSSKQFEVFDVELLSIQDCTRRTIGFYSDVVCG